MKTSTESQFPNLLHLGHRKTPPIHDFENSLTASAAFAIYLCMKLNLTPGGVPSNSVITKDETVAVSASIAQASQNQSQKPNSIQ